MSVGTLRWFQQLALCIYIQQTVEMNAVYALPASGCSVWKIFWANNLCYYSDTPCRMVMKTVGPLKCDEDSDFVPVWTMKLSLSNMVKLILNSTLPRGENRMLIYVTIINYLK